ncbi:TrbG/VirB9 family P-type conjugative transfer protein [Rhizobium sp. BT-226]|uniref:TrbG/VirB9 family P-type conjugative transfer protein n=1 Tax=Rhizobium sp. BT-226 TaxID=2986922 RepID=UPI0021F70741|nr:TrbG/VirB9 family P-type conjugative transfer protein [Rhizobium sp. BT-226]MCW0021360.1 TrbG/VirB9 family P-type conjugative transfer protein [Rhizobium sp. BT-226]
MNLIHNKGTAMFKQVMISGLVAAMATPVLADQNMPSTQQLAVRDPRIRSVSYGENSVYQIAVPMKAVSAVEFSKEEQVESILIGDSASWEVVKLKNGHVVSIKPTIAAAATNMTIYTDRRVYTFEIRSLAESAGVAASPPIRSVFAYPADREKRSASPPRPEIINSNYMVSGKGEFRPVWVQDNGRQTSFFLPEGAPRPAVFKVGDKKDEQLINSRTQGNRIVVDGVSDFWVLRIGDRSICIGRGGAVKQTSHLAGEKPSGGNHAG